MTSREEKIENWIELEEKKLNRKEKIIPSSTEKIRHKPVGSGLEAFYRISCELSLYESLPDVLSAGINSSRTTLVFSGDDKRINLSYPFYQENNGYEWFVNHEDVHLLPDQGQPCAQVSGVTAIGNSIDGTKMLVNLNQMKIFGVMGEEDFVDAFMIGQVMEQATESWSPDQHIWLVGYGELAPKIINFLSTNHKKDNFHTAEHLSNISPEEISDNSTTLYVKNSDRDSIKFFKELNNGKLGMITDSLLTDRAMFIYEEEDGIAAIGPDNYQCFPHLVAESDDLYQAMLVSYEKAKEEAVNNNTKLVDADSYEEEMSNSVEYHSLNIVTGSTEKYVKDVNKKQVDLVAEMRILGSVEAHLSGGVITGKPAEALALLTLSGGSLPARYISEMLWPQDPPEGNTARKRRSRLVAKINSVQGDFLTVGDKWSVPPLSTDFQELIHILESSTLNDQSDFLSFIDFPLHGCQRWADIHRRKMQEKIESILNNYLEKNSDTAQGLLEVETARNRLRGQ